MKTIIQTMLEEIFEKAKEISKEQTIGEKRDYYITLEQLNEILKSFERDLILEDKIGYMALFRNLRNISAEQRLKQKPLF